MSVIDKALFSGEGGIGEGEKNRIIVGNFTSDISAALSRSFGWSDTTVCGSMGLALAADNESVDRSVFVVSGPIDSKTILVEGNKLWPDSDGKVRLAITLKNGNIFNFSAGGLASDIVAQEDVEHGVFALEEGRQPAPILANDFEEWGVGKFALRMLCTVSKNTSQRAGVVIKYTVLIFPLDKDNLINKYEAAQSPGWPGIRLVDGHMPLLPRAEKPWGCPVLPFIKKGTTEADQGGWPPAAELQRAIGATMGAAVKAVVAKTATSLLNKWQRIASNPGDLTEERGDVVWPLAELPSDNGKKKYM